MAEVSQAAKRAYWGNFITVTHALLLRELDKRSGNYRLSYVWALAEPLAHVIFLSIIFGLRSRTAPQGIEFPIFVVTGLIPFQYFGSMVLRCMTTVENNKNLFSYRQVKPFDTLFTHIILELVIYAIVFVVFMVGAGWFGFNVKPQDPLKVLLIFLMLGLFGTGLGAGACVLKASFPDIARLIPLLMRPLYFISGIFFAVEVLPANLQEWLLWNPLLHAFELIREAYFYEINASRGDISYVLAWTVCSLFIGLLVFHVQRYRLVAT